MSRHTTERQLSKRPRERLVDSKGCLVKICLAEIRVRQFSLCEIGPGQDRPLKICAFEVYLGEVGAAQVSTGETCSAQVDAGEDCVAEVHLAQI
jgi:hypothetical protein